MILTKKQIEALIGESEVMLGGAIKSDKIKAYLLNYRYDDPRLATGTALLDNAKTFYENRIVKGGQQLVATSAMEEAVEQARLPYNEYLTIGRMILKHETIKLQKYSMNGERKKDFHGWAIQGMAFYNSVLADPDMLTKYEDFGVTREKLENGRTAIENAAQVNVDQEGAKSDSQLSTWERNNVIFELEDYIDDFRTILKLALAPEPQLLERVGIVAK